ncbi:MAG TPA: hypothetical protein VJR26_02645 [Candidatus Acidoferrales bacterium]|nr:hypothetical protein [Candidatus Acidoferrales bacterium]
MKNATGEIAPSSKVAGSQPWHASCRTPRWSLDSRAGGVIAAISLMLAMARSAMAQGCAACYESAAASGEQGRAALRHGILILLIPTLCLVGVIAALVYRRRNASGQSEAETEAPSDQTESRPRIEQRFFSPVPDVSRSRTAKPPVP